MGASMVRAATTFPSSSVNLWACLNKVLSRKVVGFIGTVHMSREHLNHVMDSLKTVHRLVQQHACLLDLVYYSKDTFITVSGWEVR